MQKSKTATKKGLNLLVKIMAIVLLPMVVLVVFAVLALRAVGGDTAGGIMKQTLSAMEYSMEVNLNNFSDGDYHYEADGLYKGDVNLTQGNEFLVQYKENTGIDTVVFGGDKALVSSMNTDVASIVLDKEVSSTVLSGKEYYSCDMMLGGVEYFAIVKPLYANDVPVAMMLMAMPVSEAEAIYSTVITSNVWFMIILVLLFCALAAAVVLMIVKALMAVVGNLDRVAAGQLNFSISKKLLARSDEVGKIARSVHGVIVEFSQILTGMRRSMGEMNDFTGRFTESFDAIGQSIENVNIAVNEIADGATKQASDTQSVSESLQDMNEAINNTGMSVTDLSDSAVVMEQNNETMAATLKELVEITERTHVAVEKVYRQTNLTNESVQAIQAATDIIAGIANQTNLLSLNASIEAARAGEMGKGFAVVAEQIRGLADQSRQSADQIRGIVETLIQNSNDSVNIMNSMVGEIQGQSDKLKLTRNTFDDLNTEIKKVVGAVTVISSEIEKIDQYKNGVLESVDDLSVVSQNNAASTQETAATLEQLEQIVAECRKATAELVVIADELTSSANKFKLS